MFCLLMLMGKLQNTIESYICAAMLLLKLILLVFWNNAKNTLKPLSVFDTRKKSSTIFRRCVTILQYSQLLAAAIFLPEQVTTPERTLIVFKAVSSSSSSLSAALVFRDNAWQLVPTNLLVKSEIIAVGAGAPFPARVRVLEPQVGEKNIYGQESNSRTSPQIRSMKPAIF